MSHPAQFSASERHFLLCQRGIAERMLATVESLGIASLDELVALGADELCRRVQAAHGWDVWSNRRRAWRAAIEAATAPTGRPGRRHAADAANGEAPLKV